MSRRSLVILWRLLAGSLAVVALGVVAAAVLPEDIRMWTSLTAVALVLPGFVLTWRSRPRSGSLPPHWTDGRADLAAIERGEPIPSVARRNAALEGARRNAWGLLNQVPVWGFQALLWGSFASFSPLWLRACVLPLVVVATVWLWWRAGRRLAQIDRYEDTCPPMITAS